MPESSFGSSAADRQRRLYGVKTRLFLAAIPRQTDRKKDKQTDRQTEGGSREKIELLASVSLFDYFDVFLQTCRQQNTAGGSGEKIQTFCACHGERFHPGPPYSVPRAWMRLGK